MNRERREYPSSEDNRIPVEDFFLGGKELRTNEQALFFSQ
jgi:hypothetical protein